MRRGALATAPERNLVRVSDSPSCRSLRHTRSKACPSRQRFRSSGRCFPLRAEVPVVLHRLNHTVSRLVCPTETLSTFGSRSLSRSSILLLSSICIFFLFSAASWSSEEQDSSSPFLAMFWMCSKGSTANNDADRFAQRLRSNWNTQPTARKHWWQRDKSNDGVCGGDPSDGQIQAAYELLHRNFPSFINTVQFSRNIDCSHANGCFSITIEESVLCIRGSSGVELASGLHWFIKEHCEGMSTWSKTGGTEYMEGCLTTTHLEALRGGFLMKRERTVPLSFYQNPVTSSYSTAFWNWQRWEAEIDWMAMHGVNLPLALSGQEFIWIQVYGELGIEFSELADFFTGPAFLSWGRMGNVQGYAGPLPWSYIEAQAALQRRIVHRMRELGMTPVFPGFAGFVPRALLQRYPEANAKKSSNWCNFPEDFCCVWLLDPKDPLFQTIGTSFVKQQRLAYGADKTGFYSIDVFNEMSPTQSDPTYLKQTSEAVYAALQAADRSAVWIMQAWLFYSDREFWNSDQIKGVLSGAPMGQLLLLDLYAERYPQWKRTKAFYGYPFIWCNLHNFGGNVEMHGAMPEIARGLHDAIRARTNVVGTGMCPEGIEQNPPVYELSSEMTFRQEEPDLANWFQSYARQRYGGKECPSAIRSWKMLSQSVYENTAHRPETSMDIPTSRPGLQSSEAVWGLKPFVWYNPNKVIEAWKELLNCAEQMGAISAYRYDLVDVGRQTLSKLATKYWKQIEAAYNQRNAAEFMKTGERLLELLNDMDALLSTHVGFLLGPVLHQARRYGTTDTERLFLERNLKLQLTIWGLSPSGDTELSDYANKEWSGLISSFYRERWRLWLERCYADIKQRKEYDSAAFVQEIVAFTYRWIEAANLNTFATEPVGDAIVVSERLYAKYRDEAWVLELSI